MQNYNTYTPPEGTRSRGNSGADRYNPANYAVPPSQQQPDPSLLAPYNQPMSSPMIQQPMIPSGPVMYEPQQQQQQQPFYPPQQAMPQHQQYPQAYRPPFPASQSYPAPPQPQLLRPGNQTRAFSDLPPPTDDANGYSPRAASPHSRHSHDSRRSHRSRGSSEGSLDGEGRKQRHHHHHRHHDKREEARPTVGDTLYSIFDALKSALGPRDKY